MNEQELVLVLDAGTGGGRALVFNARGELKARAYRSWKFSSLSGLELLAKEFNPQEFWQILCQCTREVLEKVDKKKIKAVSSTSMRQGCVFLDKEGNYIYAGPNRDVRGIIFAQEIEESFDNFHSRTGRWPPWIFVPSRLKWFEKQMPQLHQKIHHILMLNDWILFELCGEFAGEPSSACESMLFDLSSASWSQELLDQCQLGLENLPEIYPAGTMVGEVSKKAEQESGIPQGIPVVVGGADSQCALLGAGIIKPHQAGLIAGTTMPVMMTIDHCFIDPKKILWTHCYLLKDLWVVESQAGEAGSSFAWYVEKILSGLLNAPPQEVYPQILARAEKIPPGANGIRAYLGTMVWNLSRLNPLRPSALLFPYPFESEKFSPEAIARAILEAIAYAGRANLEQIESATGISPQEVFICGGLSQSRLFNQIVASVLNCPCKVAGSPESAGLGTAICAFVGVGVYPDLKTGAEEMSGSTFLIEPVAQWQEAYQEGYKKWREEYDKFDQCW